MRKLLATLLILVGSSTFAYDYNTCCNDECCTDWCSGWTACADYLYWRTTNSSLDYVSDGGLGDGSIINVCPDYDSGYRLSLFKEDICSCWVMGAVYTSYCATTTDRRVDTSTTTPFTSTRFSFPFTATVGANNAQGEYKVDYQVVDLIAGYTHCFECVDAWARPYAGVRLAWIDQRMQADYRFASSVFRAGRIVQKLDMEGYGLEVGIDGRLGFCDSRFGLTGHAGLSVLHGRFDASLLQLSDSGVASPSALQQFNSVDLDLVNKARIAKVPVFEIGLGLDWNVCCSECFDFSVAAGYEFQAWRTPNFLFADQALFQSDIVVPDRDRAFLGFQGLFVRVCIDY